MAVTTRDKRIGTIRKYLQAIVSGCTWINVGMLSLLVLLIVSNIVSRALFKKPVLGTIEMAELLTLITVFLSLAYTEVRKAHVRVDLLTCKFQSKVKMVLAFAMSFLTATYFIAMSWQGGAQMLSYLSPLRTTGILSIPLSPFMLIIAFGSLMLGLLILTNMLSASSDSEIQKNKRVGDL